MQQYVIIVYTLGIFLMSRKLYKRFYLKLRLGLVSKNFRRYFIFVTMVLYLMAHAIESFFSAGEYVLLMFLFEY